MRDNPEHSQTYMSLAQTAPKLFLEGKTPRLVDEWQDAPELWDAARYAPSKIDTDKMKVPSFLMVLTGTGSFAYRRKEDGIWVVPIGCLKP